MDEIKREIMEDADNASYSLKGIDPLYAAPSTARIVIVGQAPGIVAQESRMFWNDRSGERLRSWMGIDWETFYHSGYIAVLPMDFYYPGKGKSGDLPPRKGFAEKWHPKLLATMPERELFLLVGAYAQDYYLGSDKHTNLTKRVARFQDYLPEYFPLVHPSPRNQLWLAKNPWFEEKVIPVLQQTIARILSK